MAYPATPKDSNNIPIGCAYVPGTGFIPIQGSSSINTDGSGNQSTLVLVSDQSTGWASATMQSAASANGNGTSLSVLGYATVAFTVSGTFSATVNFEGTEDNSNWSAIEVTPFNSTSPATTATATGSFIASCAGMQSVRARISGYASGNVTVTAHAVPLSSGGSGGGGGGGSNSSVSLTGSSAPGSATYIGGNKSGNLTGLSLDGSGNLNVNVAAGGGSGGTSSSFGSAFPSTGTAIGASDGTNMQGLLVESSSNKNLRVALYNGSTEATVTGSNALKIDGSAVTQPVSGTVTANVGTTNGLALDTSVNGVIVSQGSTTSGEKGPLIQGAVTTSAPSYTTAQTSPISLTTAGAVRVDGSAVTQPISGTITANAGTNLNTSALALESGGNLATLAGAVTSSKVQANVAQINGVAPSMGNGISGTGVQRVTIASDSTGQVTLAAGSNTIGALTANQSVNVAQVGGSSVSTAASGVQKVGIVGNSGATVDSTVAAGSAPTNSIVAGVVYNSTAPAPTSGQAMALQADQAGNTRVFPGVTLAALSAWNSGTALNTTQNIFTNSGAEAVLVQLTQTTTLSAGAITFEVSYDNSNWSTIPANCALDPTSTTFAQISLPYTVQASTNKQFLLNMNGAQGLRIKLSTQITGSGAVTPNYALLPYSPSDAVIAYSPTAANFNAQVVGVVASGASNSGNPVKVGGAFNTTQPTVTNGQVVDAQMTARGAQIVATGVDAFSINNAQVSGTAISVSSGTSDAGTQRVIMAGAATGTKSNVASSASSVTILASNTSRKGAMIYNDSTQILYLDLSGGTASSTSYSVQIPAQGFFELPPTMIYNGAITGIWAAANGNARVTEFS
jgi:hypothetical protein